MSRLLQDTKCGAQARIEGSSNRDGRIKFGLLRENKLLLKMFTQCSFMSLKGCFQKRPGPPAGGMQAQPVWGDSPAGQPQTRRLNFVLCAALQVPIFGRHRVVCVCAVTS